MTQMEVAWTQQSTIGRSLPRPPRVVRGAFAALSRSTPRLAARLAEVLFLRPPRRRAPERERGWVDGATRLELRVAERRLAVWTLGAGPTVLMFAALHGLHFLVAVLCLVFVANRAFADRYDHEYYWGVALCGYFWHALGVAWLFVLVIFAIGL